MQTKTCTKCGGSFPATAEYFCRSAAGRNRLFARCKSCVSLYRKVHRHTAGGTAMAARDRVRTQTPDYRERQRKWRKVRRLKPGFIEKERAQKRAWRVRAKAMGRWPTPADREWMRNYMRNRRRDKAHYLNSMMQVAIVYAIKKGVSQFWWEKHCGYTAADLKAHLESQFVVGMTWENHGAVWEIDHVRPLAAFYIPTVDCDAFREAWALSNLRPLLKHLNRAKGAKLDFAL